MFIEMTASITFDPSLSINLKVADLVEKSNSSQVMEMRNVLKETLAGFPVSQVSLPAKKVSAISAETDKNITDKQAGFLRKLLSDNSISESDFCKEHAVEKLEQLPMKDAQQIIKDLKEQR